MLKDGLFWRLSNGDTNRIWRDKWLDDSSFFYNKNIKDAVLRYTKVSALINKETTCWNRAIIAETLGEDMVDVVCKIPFSRLGLQDIIIRSACNNERFSVRSAYHLDVRRRRRVEEHSSRQDKLIDWQKIRDLKIPNNSKIFF